VVAIVFAAYVYAMWNQRGLSLHLTVAATRPATGSPVESLPDHVLRAGPSPAPIFEGDGMEVEIELVTSGSPRGPAWVHGTLGEKEVALGTGLVPREGWKRLKVVRELRRGPVDATAWQLGSSDAFGFFRTQRAFPDREVALVLPRFASLREQREVLELEASVSAPRSGAGSELFGVREFRPGDSLRRIHWRSSARHGELVVREYEPPGFQTLSLFLDPAPASVEVADQLARIAASEAWDCVREGGRVMLWAPGCEPSEPRQARDLWALLDWLARYPWIGTRGLTEPPLGQSGEVALVTASGNPALTEAVDVARRRGARVRAWVVGDAEVGLDLPVRRAGTKWPL
jgi:uncharacterized protein (DUF58 family)